MSDTIKSYKLPKAVLAFHLFRVVSIWLLGVVPTWLLSHDLSVTLFLAVILFILGAIIFFIAYLDYHYFSIEIGVDSLTIKSGIIVKNIKTIAFKAIQSVDVSYDPVIQVFDLVLVKVWSSSPQQFHINDGDSTNRPELAFYMSKAEAEALKQEVAVR